MSFEAVGVKLVAEEGNYFSTMNKAQGAVDDFGGKSKSVFSQMPGLADIAVGAFHAIGTVAVDAFFKAGQAAVGFFTDSIGAAGDFEAGMNSFAAVAGGALDEAGLKTEDFKKLFLDLGKELPVSTKEVQDAATEMIKGGIDPATVAAGGLKQNIQFAAAAMEGDLAGAAEVSAKILGGWAEQGATAAERAELLTNATDLLTKAANASTVDVKELALGLYNVQGTAKATGLSLDETTTALAELSPRFASSSEAGTSFKNFLVRLQPSTKPAIGAMKDLGLYTDETGSAFFDAQGKFVGVAKASQLLQDATKGLTDAQKVQALQTIFGNDAMNSAAAFAEMGAQGFNDMTAAMEKQNGVQATAQTVQQGYNVALDNFHGSIEALQITIGSLLLPVLTSLFNDYLAPGINTLTNLAAAISGDDEAFNSLSDGMQALVTVIDAIMQGFGEGGLLGALNQLIPGLNSTSESASGLGGVIDQLSGIWNNLIAVITSVAEAYQNVVMAIFSVVADFLAENGDEILADISDVWDQIVEVINLALALYKAIVPPILNAIAGFISEHTEEIKLIFGGAWKIIHGIIDGALTLIKGILSAALKVLSGDWEGAWQDIQDMSARFVADILEVISGGLDLIKGAFDTIIDAIRDIWNTLVGDAAGIGNDIINGIIDGIEAAADHLFDVLRNLAEDALQAAQDALDIGSPSKKFRKQVGRQIPIGMALGVMDTMPMLTRTLQAGMASTVASSASMIAGATTNATYNQQRSINMTYNTTHAPNAAMNYAIAQALL